MAKTNFIDENPATGIKGTYIEASFLNSINTHRHDGVDADGHGALDYAPDNGAADAYAIALTPALEAYITGMPLWFKAAHANTGAATLDINALGPVAIKKSGTAALVTGDIVAGQMVCLVYDGVNFQMPAPETNKFTGRNGTLQQLQAAATGSSWFFGFDEEVGTLYIYPGNEAAGLITVGGLAAKSDDVSGMEPERG